MLGDTMGTVHTLAKLCQFLVFFVKVPHQSQSPNLFLAEKSETGMRTDVDSVRLGTHEGGTDDHSLTAEDNVQAHVMSKERETPGFGSTRALGGRRKKKPEVVGVLIEDCQTVDELTEEVVGKGTANSFVITVWREGSLEDVMDKVLDLRGTLIESDTACVNISQGLGQKNITRQLPGLT